MTAPPPRSPDAVHLTLSDPLFGSPCSRLLGLEMLDYSVEHGWATMAFTATSDMVNRIGSVQGGIVTAMLDDAMGVAACMHKHFEIVVPTLSLTTNFLKPAPPGRLIARGEVLRMGRSNAFMQGELRDPAGVLLATATASAAVRPRPPGV